MASPAPPSDGLTALVVDDVAPMRAIVRRLLHLQGFEAVFECDDVAAAIEIAAQERPDIALIDLYLTGHQTGLDFVRAVRASDNPTLPVLAMSSDARRSAIIAARDAGVNGFIGKPLNPAALLRKVNRALNDPQVFVRTATYFGPDRRFGRRDEAGTLTPRSAAAASARRA